MMHMWMWYWKVNTVFSKRHNFTDVLSLTYIHYLQELKPQKIHYYMASKLFFKLFYAVSQLHSLQEIIATR